MLQIPNTELRNQINGVYGWCWIIKRYLSKHEDCLILRHLKLCSDKPKVSNG